LYEPKEENPMLGWRGASRYYDPKFKTAFGLECKAMKKVREEMGFENVVPMIPFCRTPEEGKKVIEVMKENGLDREKDKSLKVYVMCEIPSNILLADEFLAIYYWNGSFIVDELAYGTELTNEYLAGKIKEVGRAHTIADSAEPKSIAEQNGYGIQVLPCEKGKDSVDFRIKVTSTKKIFVTKRSTNVWQSYENYAWAEDKDGNPRGVPDHHWSHAMDAIMYPMAHMHNKSQDIPPPPRRYIDELTRKNPAR
jgi:hypothetical protein